MRLPHLLIISLLVGLCAATASAGSPRVVLERDTVLPDQLVVDSAQTLEIKPGVSILVDGYHPILVQGILVALGTADKPIRITAKGRPRGSMDRPGWQGLVVAGAHAHARMSHCRLEGAYANGFWGCPARVDSCEFVGNYHGVYCGRGATPHLQGCRIYRNVYGISVNSSSPMLLDNTVTENTVGMHLEFASESAIGRNRFELNTTDVRRDSVVGDPSGDMSVQKLWDVMRKLY